MPEKKLKSKAIKILKSEVVRIDSLKPHPRNYRTHPDGQIAHLSRSIAEHGIYRNVVCARDGVILAGHGIVEAAKRAGLKEIPIVRLRIASTDPQALKVMLGDNEIAGLSENDLAGMAGLLEEIKKSGGRKFTVVNEKDPSKPYVVSLNALYKHIIASLNHAKKTGHTINGNELSDYSLA